LLLATTVRGAQVATNASSGAALNTSTRTLGNVMLVTALIPAGNNQVTLQTCKPGGGTWMPRMVQRVSGKARNLTFTIAKPKTPETFRIWVEKQPLPSAFYAGKHSFGPSKGTSANLATFVNLATALAAPASGAPTSGSSTPVTKADIWQIVGNRLYFFNQYRGLQVIDITQPDAPRLLGQLDLPAAGEEMYVLDASHIILLAQDCSNDNGQTDVDVINVATGIPVISASLPVSGYLDDSRLVGSALYVACDAFGGSGTNATWGTQISSFDCSNPEAPAARSSLWLPGYGNVVTAAATCLFVAVQDPANWWQSDLNCIDISTGNGTMNNAAVIQTAGQIADPSDINLNGGVLTTISQVQDQTNYSESVTIETFSLADLSSPVALGNLQLNSDQALSAASFDTNLVFISTFDSTAPLYVVDLSNPASPNLAGQINLPGSQNFMYPLGSRLITIGLGNWTNWQTTVSLFDVSNPANPMLLSQVGVGDSNSWSEAGYDPEAFTILPDDGLILVPFQSWSANNDASGVQIIDLAPNALTARGIISQAQARRATIFQNRVLSISGQEYLSVDISNQDSPSVTSLLTLAWPVDTVVVAGQYLLEFGGANFDQPDTVIRVTQTASPGALAAQFSLTNGPVLGAVLQSNLLYVLEGNGPDSTVIVDPIFGPVQTQPLVRSKPRNVRPRAATTATNATMTLNVIDTSQLPNLALVGQTVINVTDLPSRNVQALWTQPNELVWVGSLQQNWFAPLLAAPTTGGTLMAYPGSWFWNSRGIQMWTFDVSNSGSPALASAITVATNGWSDGGVAVAENGLVYLSHSQWIFSPLQVLRPPTSSPTTTNLNHRPSARQKNTIVAPPAMLPVNFSWSQSSYLDVVDLSNPAAPALRPAVSIPGPLAGVSRGGNVLYSLSSSWQTGQTLQALAYDGVTAYQVASLPLGAEWNASPVVYGETIFTAENDTAGTTNRLTSWTLTDQATFAELGNASFGLPIDTLASFHDLLGVQAGDAIYLFNASQPAALQSIGSGTPPGCMWPSLTGADGGLSSGLWSPLGDYGVFLISN
jgi:hypothetical protein